MLDDLDKRFEGLTTVQKANALIPVLTQEIADWKAAAVKTKKAHKQDAFKTCEKSAFILEQCLSILQSLNPDLSTRTLPKTNGLVVSSYYERIARRLHPDVWTEYDKSAASCSVTCVAVGPVKGSIQQVHDMITIMRVHGGIPHDSPL